MTSLIRTHVTASVTELKKNPMGTLATGHGHPVAILNRSATAFYCVPAKAYEALLERIDDLELNAIADARNAQKVVKIKLHAL